MVMELLVSVVLLGAIAGVYAIFYRKAGDNIGSGYGKSYMKEKWGIEEENK